MEEIINTELESVSYRNQNGFPPTICIQLLNWCNLSCKSCRSNSSPYMKDYLSYETLEPILLKLKDFGLWRISLTGGEPFYWKEINQLLVLLYKLEFPFSITTNGFASKKFFDSIEQCVWDRCTLYVSIDGDKEIHNALRGRNSYENAISFLRYVRPKVKRLFVNTVLFTNPAIWAKNLYNELEQIGVDNWTIISPVKQGRWFENINASVSYKEQYNEIKSIVKSKPTSSFLDFSKTDNVLTDIVFIDSNGSVRLPGYFDKSYSTKPLSRKIEIQEDEVVPKIIMSVNKFINSEKYIL